MSFAVGLTGGAGSGKSEAASVFAALGARLVDADELAREVLAPGSRTLARLVELLGRDIVDSRGALRRRALRRRIFASPAARREVEAAVHPEVRRRLAARLAAGGEPYVVAVIPLLVESGMAPDFDRILVIDCPESLQVERLMQRDGETAVGARRMLAAQAGRAARLAVADDVILNDGSLAQLASRVQALHRRYLAAARQRPAPTAGP